MKFKAYYTENRVYSGGFDEWKAMPSSGLLVAIHFIPKEYDRWDGVHISTIGKTYYSGGDWYWVEDQKIHYISSGEWGTWKERPNVSCQSCIKRGGVVSDKEFSDLYQQILIETR